MSGHMVTPYEFTATMKRVPKEQRDEELLLASIGKRVTVDLLDAVAPNITEIEPVKQTDGSWQMSCVRAKRSGDKVTMVFAIDQTGERELVLDGNDPARPVIFTKGTADVTRIYACGMLWRPADGTTGVLLLHSPWGRGGSRSKTLTLLQRAVNAVEGAQVQLHADPMIPAKVLARWLRQANATKIVYTKDKRIRSTFGDTDTAASAVAEMDLVVKGSASIPYRDALKAALRASANKDKFFTVTLREVDGDDREETFDDVTVELDTGGGLKRYSMRNETVPTVSFNRTPEMNKIYFDLPDNKNATWPDELLANVGPEFDKVLQDVQLDQ